VQCGLKRRRLYGVTGNDTRLNRACLDPNTSTLPLVAPAGTVGVINVLETTWKVAGVAWNVTLVTVFRLFPRILTVAPTLQQNGAQGLQFRAAKGGSPSQDLQHLLERS
jgi:hypothetical protein